jgi:hypothetical protein
MKTLGMISGKHIMKEAGGIMKEEVEAPAPIDGGAKLR